MFRHALFCGVGICVASIGCGGSVGIKLYPAAGKVVYQGKPVANCVITLIPTIPIIATSKPTGVTNSKDNGLGACIYWKAGCQRKVPTCFESGG